MFGIVAIRIFCATLAAMAILAVATTTAQAGVDISTKPTQNMSCSAGVCSPTAKKAVLNVNDVTTMLAAGDLKVTTGSGALDIHIDAPFSWANTSRLTLDAQRSIEFKKPVTVAGTGALTLTTNDGGTGGDYWFDSGASVTFWDTSSSLTINGLSFTLVRDISTLASDIAANSSGSFALANSYDASVDGTYAHAPLAKVFRGTIEGLGNAISYLSINVASKREDIGLLAKLGLGGEIRDILLFRPNVSGGYRTRIGALVGTNSYGTIAYAQVIGGTVTTTGPAFFVGGLVGRNGLRIAEHGLIALVVQSSASAKIKTNSSFIGGAWSVQTTR